ncbi:MAG: AAA family ATPase [Thermomicrobiales bacterium]
MASLAIEDQLFVGRQSELATLLAQLDDAAAGRGGVALLSGEPGIGKTRSARAFAAVAESRHARVLWGHCYEGDWSPPYAPWIEAISSVFRAAGPDRAQDLLDDPTRTSLATLVPDLASPGGESAAPVALSREEERFRLFDAAARVLLKFGETAPVLVVLDDLQWADSASLDLLLHLAFFARQGRLFVLGTYRDLDLDPRQPLAQLLPVLRREAGTTFIALKGLAVEDVVSLLGDGDGGHDLALTIHAETNGNPFYIEELVRHLVEEGKLVRDGSGLIAPGGLTELGIPDSVRQLVTRRLTHLSPDAERMLTHAAVFPDGFEFAVLPPLTGLPEDALLDAVDETLAARLIQPASDIERYDFVHAIVRHALSETWSPSRRVRIHRRAAEALAAIYAGHEMDHAPELAVQYHRSLTLPGAATGIQYALAAAERVRRGHAPEQAVVFLRMARDLAASEDAETRAGILCSLALAEADAAMGEEARATIDDALSALHASGADETEIADFIALAANSLRNRATVDSRIWRPLVEHGLQLVRERHDPSWARLMLLVDPIEPLSLETVRAGLWLGFDPDAVAILHKFGDEDDIARSVESYDPRTRAETEAYLARARRWQQPTAVMQAITVAANDFHYRHGAFRDAEALWRELIAIAQQAGAIAWEAQAWNQLTWLHIATGHFAEARASEERANELLSRLGPGRQSGVLAMEMATSFAVYLGGDWSSIAAFWTNHVDAPVLGPYDVGTLSASLYGAIAAYADAEIGAADEASRLLQTLIPIFERTPARAANHNGAVAFAGGAVWRLGLSEFAPALRRFALDLIAAGVGDYPQGSNELTVARMAAMIGNDAEATDYFARARTVLHLSEQRPLRAIVDLDEATARAKGDPGRAAELASSALAAFDTLGMGPWAAVARKLEADCAMRVGAGRAVFPAGLTEREVDVLRLVARGHSDRQISEELYISPRTVNAHLRNMLTKTDSANRTELSIWAFEHGLVTRGDSQAAVR